MSLTAPIFFLVFAGWLCLAGQVLSGWRFVRRPVPAPDERPPVSVLKPLHGAEPGLYDNLRSFVEQDYPDFQIVLGVNRPDDAALADARALIRDFPERDIALVVDQRIRGSNQKVANLENMLSVARHEVLVMADSDMRVDRDYLAAVTAPLRDPRVGVVTCLYSGVSAGGLWSEMGALQINFGFLPNALLADMAQIGNGCFGATIALTRTTLDRVGGFAPIRDELADDRRLGDAVRAHALRVMLSRYLVASQVHEPSLAALWRHELRWARTMRQLAPLGFAGSVVTHPLAIALVAAAATGFAPLACVLLALTCLLRWAAAAAFARVLGLPARKLWLLPVRDGLSFAVFVASFFGRRVFWRDQSLHVEPSGRMTVAD
jgi:ceramide glucosyltransferase